MCHQKTLHYALNSREIANFLSHLDKTSYSHQASTTTKNRGTLRALPSVTPDYRPFKAETALSLEKIRPKRELKTPVMSGYGV